MRIKQELKLPKTPRSLWINNKSIQELRNFFPEEDGNIISPETCSHSNKSIQDLREFYPEEERGIISPETCSHRHQQGWQHLPNLPVQNILNNNNNISITNNNNINNNPDEVVTLASSSPHQVDGSGGDEDDIDDYQSQQSHDEDDSDESSSGDEDSSISFSDTSPLLDVSSLDEDSSTSSDDSDEDDDTDMCEDDGIPEDDDNIEDRDDNVDDGFEEEEDDHGCSMDTSWMSVSSAASVDVPSASDNRSQAFEHHRDRNGIVLPDVLPVSVSKANNEEITPDGVKKIVDATLRELTLRVKKRSELKLDPVPRLLSRDCCIVEITTQPDIQVDIRLNSASSAPGIPISEAYVRHGNTYPPREVVPPTPTIKNYNNHCTKTDVEETEVRSSESQSFRSGSSRENRASPKFFALGEGVRLNNFSIVNGFKAVSLTELVKTDDDESVQSETPNKVETTNSISIEEPTSPSPIKDSGDVPPSQTFPEKLPNHSAGGFNLYSKENRRHYKNYATLEQRPCLDVSKPCPVVSSQDNRNGIVDVYAKSEKLKSEPILNHSHNSSVQQLQPKQKTNNVSPPLSKKNEGKLSSPELFEVYTMETAIPHISWAAVGRSNRESDWLKKRRNDREEIRRKLAMDSDNEDYVAEKMMHNQESSSIDRLKGGSNLQICFMNEAAKNTEVVPEAETVIESNVEKTRKPLPKMLMSNLLFPPSLQKDTGNSKVQNNNNSQPQVVKRQRPTFFFNRPRSWHAAKVEEKHDPEEDLFTRHRRLQAEAREALAQAKDMARMQMEIERQKKKKSPIADIVGISFPDGQNSLSRHALLDMNVAQLQVIVNDLHSQIETLNENLVKFLLERDDLHMEQDSMLVDIEDLTRYLGLKGSCSVTHSTDSKLPLNVQVSSNNKKILNSEPVRRSQSVHLKKPKHFMWPLQRFSLLNRGTGRG